jgi:hypothetical protein
MGKLHNRSFGKVKKLAATSGFFMMILLLGRIVVRIVLRPVDAVN